MCSEICPPRISFSCDLELESVAHPMILDSGSGPDFEFSFEGSLEFDPCQSSADELFADGMILPIFHKGSAGNVPIPRRASLPPLPLLENPKREFAPKEDEPGLCTGPGTKPASRSFWGFKRSASLNNAEKKGLICSLPLLLRSNSTGSVPNPKKVLQKQPSIKMAKSSSYPAPSSSSSVSGYSHQKPPLSRKTSHGHGSWNGARRVTPVLNVPSPYIIGTANLFGISSFFCNGKDKKKIRR